MTRYFFCKLLFKLNNRNTKKVKKTTKANNKDTQNKVNDVALVSLLCMLTLNIWHLTFFLKSFYIADFEQVNVFWVSASKVFASNFVSINKYCYAIDTVRGDINSCTTTLHIFFVGKANLSVA